MSIWSKLTPDGKGGFDLLSNWNIGTEVLYRGGAKLIFFMAFACLFGPLFPLFFIISYPIRTLEGKVENVVTGGLLSLIVLLDYWLGGIGWVFYQHYVGGEFNTMYMFFAKLDLAMLIFFIGAWFATPLVGDKVDIFNGPSLLIYYGFLFILMYKVLLPICGYITDGTMSETPIWFLEGLINN